MPQTSVVGPMRRWVVPMRYARLSDEGGDFAREPEAAMKTTWLDLAWSISLSGIYTLPLVWAVLVASCPCIYIHVVFGPLRLLIARSAGADYHDFRQCVSPALVFLSMSLPLTSSTCVRERAPSDLHMSQLLPPGVSPSALVGLCATS